MFWDLGGYTSPNRSPVPYHLRRVSFHVGGVSTSFPADEAMAPNQRQPMQYLGEHNKSEMRE